MTLQQLEYFCAVCRYHSITRAAEELFVSQPTISVALRNLEKEFNLRLFNHGKNQISLTADGEAFYQKAEILLGQTQDFYTEFSGMHDRKRALRIGIPPILSTVFFPQMRLQFRQKYPNIAVELLEYGSMRACNLVESEELDAAIVNLDFYNVDRFNYRVFTQDHFVFCVSQSNPLAGEQQVTLEQLREEPIVLFSADSVQNRTMLSRYRSHGINPHIVMRSSQLYTILKYVHAGLAGAFLYSCIPVEDPSLVRIPVEPAITSEIGAIWKKGIYMDDDLSKFVKFIQSYRLVL